MRAVGSPTHAAESARRQLAVVRALADELEHCLAALSLEMGLAVQAQLLEELERLGRNALTAAGHPT